MAGKLFIVSTPIGNLEDMTFRAVRTLQEVTIIAAEDTRRTQKLCTHYQIGTPLTSYHDFNKEEKTPVLLSRIKEGADIALVSDAGTPLISDPGYYLIRQAIREHVSVVPIPGPSAILAALVASGFPPDAFIFEGFLPRKSGARLALLQNLQEERRTTIVFETPHRIASTLEAIRQTLPGRRLMIARELTKFNEEMMRGTAEELLQSLQKRELRGEMTLVIEGRARKARKRDSSE